MEQPAMDSEVIEPASDDESLLSINDEEAEEVEEDEEIDVDGHKISLPKSKAEKLKSERLMHADYTRKTQEAANERRQLEAAKEEFTRHVQIQNEFSNDLAVLTNVESQLRQYEQVNWDAYGNEDPVEAQKQWIKFTQLKEQKGNLVGVLQQKQSQRQFFEQQEIAKRIESGQAELAKDIKGWGAELAGKLAEFVRSDGWDEGAIKNITPSQVKSLHRLYVASNAIKNQSSPVSAIQAKPVSKLSANASVKKDPSKMSDAEFANWRRATAQRK